MGAQFDYPAIPENRNSGKAFIKRMLTGKNPIKSLVSGTIPYIIKVDAFAFKSWNDKLKEK
jgi:hypothetical protein